MYGHNDFHWPNTFYYPAQDFADPLLAIATKRTENQRMITEFVENNSKEFSGDEENEGNKGKEKLSKISEARDFLIKARRLMKDLRRLREDLSKDKACAVTDEEWSKKLEEAALMQREVNEILESVESAEKSTIKSIEKRRKKRKREARQRVSRRMEKNSEAEKRLRRDRDIDAWIREKCETIERVKQAENLRKDADIVLAEVRGKRNDAKKCLGLLQALKNLRRIKVGVARARGENLPIAADHAFDNIFDQLLEQWSCLDREYSIEEQGLKLMLIADNDRKIEKERKSTFEDWETALFGRKLGGPSRARFDSHNFLTIRCAWDAYSNFEGNGSRIPIGWIIPSPPSSEAWKKSLKTETNQ